MTEVTEVTDAALMAAATGGDRRAFDDLVRRHTPRMYRVALRIVGEGADAEDVVQDAWISAWRALPRYRGDAAPGTWLYRVVTNAALGQLRRRRPTVPIGTNGAAGALVDPALGPEAAMLRTDDVAAVHAALGALEPNQRATLVLREFEGLSYEEVAAVLNTTTAAVRSRLHRGRATLLEQLRARERGAWEPGDAERGAGEAQ